MNRTLVLSLSLLVGSAAVAGLLILLAASPVPVEAERASESERAAFQSTEPITRYVTVTGSDATACSSPIRPCRTVQHAVDVAGEGDIILIAQGTYEGVNNHAGLSQVVYLAKSLTLRGGHAAADWTIVDPASFPTTLDAGGEGRVIYVDGPGVTATLEGLHISGGDATGLGGGTWVEDAGGGVYVDRAGVIISDCVVQNNAAHTVYSGTSVRGAGGGLYLHYSDAVLRGNRIVSNTGSTVHYGYGGGLKLNYSTALIEDNLVQGNVASTAYRGSGGGLILSFSDAILRYNTVRGNTGSTAEWGSGGGLEVGESTVALRHNLLEGNTASTLGEGRGGGLVLGGVSPIVLQDNVIRDNVSSQGGSGRGGGVFLSAYAATLRGNEIATNTATLNPAATGLGGGLYIDFGGAFTLTNDLVVDNHANTTGGGLWADASSNDVDPGRLLHTTLANNGGGGSGVYVGEYTTLFFTNTIIAGHGVGITVTAGGTATLEGTLWHDNGVDVGGGGTISTGAANVHGDPVFVGGGDYRLFVTSEAIDRGVDVGVEDDFEGEMRPAGGGPDLGADEFYPAPSLLVSKAVTPALIYPGDSLTYTLGLVNTGNITLTATLTDRVPAHTSLTGPLTWTVVITEPQDAWAYPLPAAVAPDYLGWLTNSLEASTEEGAAGYVEAVVAIMRRVYLPMVRRW